jgi:hypothetical protein
MTTYQGPQNSIINNGRLEKTVIPASKAHRESDGKKNRGNNYSRQAGMTIETLNDVRVQVSCG